MEIEFIILFVFIVCSSIFIWIIAWLFSGCLELLHDLSCTLYNAGISEDFQYPAWVLQIVGLVLLWLNHQMFENWSGFRQFVSHFKRLDLIQSLIHFWHKRNLKRLLFLNYKLPKFEAVSLKIGSNKFENWSSDISNTNLEFLYSDKQKPQNLAIRKLSGYYFPWACDHYR